MTTDDDGDDGNDSPEFEFERCPTCGQPVLAVVVEGPSPADRRAYPCGHRLPIDARPDPE